MNLGEINGEPANRIVKRILAVQKPSVITGKFLAILLGLLILTGLYLTSLYSYLLFHSLAELFSIIVAGGIFMIAWNSRQSLDNPYLLFIGIAYLFIGFLDLIHTLAYAGMGIFQGYGSNLPTQLWIAARYIESLSLLIAFSFLGRRLRPNLTFLGYTVAISLLLLSIFQWNIFPQSYIEGVGLTPFKKISEYVISTILIVCIVLLLRNRIQFDRGILRLLSASITLTIAAELAFTFYISVYGFSNLVGHFFKLISFYLIYKAIIETGLRNPFDLLFRNLKQSEEALQKANTELSAVNKELEAFSYSVSHDLRAPLRSIDGFSQALIEDYPDRLDERGKDYLQRVRLATQRMGRLIDDMLSLSHVTRSEMKHETVDLSALAQSIAEEFQETQLERQVEFIIIPGVTAKGDARLLQILLENLLGNAWKFTGHHPQARIEFGATQSDGKEVFFVRDDGAGFDMTYVDKLFGVFQRLHLQDEFTGTGVGLATVQRITHRHGGRVWAEGKVEEGAAFYFTLE
jgi:signal transduction histidine kinase